MRTDESYVLGYSKGIVVSQIKLGELRSHLRCAHLAHKISRLATDEFVRVVGAVFQYLFVIAIGVVLQKMEALKPKHIFVAFLPRVQ